MKRVIGLNVVIAGGIVIFLGIIGLMKYLCLRRNGVAAPAVVTEIKPSEGTRSKYDNVFLTFRTEDGQQVTGRLDSSRGVYRVGMAADIVYMSDRPEKIYLPGGKAALLVPLICIGTGAALMTLRLGGVL